MSGFELVLVIVCWSLVELAFFLVGLKRGDIRFDVRRD